MVIRVIQSFSATVSNFGHSLHLRGGRGCVYWGSTEIIAIYVHAYLCGHIAPVEFAHEEVEQQPMLNTVTDSTISNR